MIITIDGPIATGKSTIARHLARQIGFIYFDTGAIYRALAYAILRDGVDIHQREQLEALLGRFRFDVRFLRGEPRYWLNDEDVTLEIRSPEVTAVVSEIAAIASVREKLMRIQHENARGVNAVFEGRDMGTTVFPDAEIKIFLTGRPEVRARRRYDELRAKFPDRTMDLTIEQTLEQINQRDAYDTSRELSPLRQADDAYVIDTSDLSTDEIILKILEYRDSRKTRHKLPEVP